MNAFASELQSWPSKTVTSICLCAPEASVVLNSTCRIAAS